MCLAQGPQRSDAGEARTRGPSVSSQALYHWATALPGDQVWDLQCMQLASYLERGPLVWMMPLQMHVNKKSVYDNDETVQALMKQGSYRKVE